jgi:hypothetical protein
MYTRWLMFYEENGAIASSGGTRVIKSEPELLTVNDDDDEIANVPVPKFTYSRLTYRDCMNLDMEQLEALDKMGYILPGEFKDKIIQYRKFYGLRGSGEPDDDDDDGGPPVEYIPRRTDMNAPRMKPRISPQFQKRPEAPKPTEEFYTGESK